MFLYRHKKNFHSETKQLGTVLSLFEFSDRLWFARLSDLEGFPLGEALGTELEQIKLSCSARWRNFVEWIRKGWSFRVLYKFSISHFFIFSRATENDTLSLIWKKKTVWREAKDSADIESCVEHDIKFLRCILRNLRTKKYIEGTSKWP